MTPRQLRAIRGRARKAFASIAEAKADFDRRAAARAAREAADAGRGPLGRLLRVIRRRRRPALTEG